MTDDAAHLDPSPFDRARLDPSPFDPAHLDPAHLDPAHLSPANLDPAHLDPAHLDPAHLSPAHLGPVPMPELPQPARPFSLRPAVPAPRPAAEPPQPPPSRESPPPSRDSAPHSQDSAPPSQDSAPPSQESPPPSQASAPPAAPEPVPAEPEPVPAAPVPAEPEPSPVEPVEPDAAPLNAPISPAPVGDHRAAAEVPDGDALGEEIAAELAAQAAPQRPDHGEWRGVVLVTGTDTDVGKTIVTAAVAAAAQSSGLRVAVIKPGQTGIATGAPTDIEVVTRLAAPDTTRVLAEYPEPMAPLAAATVAQLPPLELYTVVDAIRAEADKHDLVLVEGAGGLLVPMGVRPSGEAWTLADLAIALGVKTIVVARAGLGTLNHTALTLEALSRRGVPAGVVIGAWPPDPELVHWANLSELLPHLMGALPDGAGRMDPGVFRRSAPGWLTPPLYGVIDNWRVWAEETDGH
jgi:dethiobiotin synthetase